MLTFSMRCNLGVVLTELTKLQNVTVPGQGLQIGKTPVNLNNRQLNWFEPVSTDKETRQRKSCRIKNSKE